MANQVAIPYYAMDAFRGKELIEESNTNHSQRDQGDKDGVKDALPTR